MIIALFALGAALVLWTSLSRAADPPKITIFNLHCTREDAVIRLPDIRHYVFRPYLCVEGGAVVYLPERVLTPMPNAPRRPERNPLRFLDPDKNVEI